MRMSVDVKEKALKSTKTAVVVVGCLAMTCAASFGDFHGDHNRWDEKDDIYWRWRQTDHYWRSHWWQMAEDSYWNHPPPRYWRGYHWDDVYWNNLKRFAVSGSLNPHHSGVEATYILRDTGGDLLGGDTDPSPSLGYLDFKANYDGEQMRLPRLETYLTYSYALPYYMSYADGHKIRGAISSLGYEYYDHSTYELDDAETEGFVAHHIHMFGVHFPMFGSNFGLGDIGYAKTGGFEQADLEAWAGDDARLSFVFFHRGYLQLRWRSLRAAYFSATDDHPHVFYERESADDVLPIDVGIKAEQLRTLFGNIEKKNGEEGDFTAIWESILADVRLQIYSGYARNDGLFLVGEFEAYRQRINAQLEEGGAFSQQASGKRITLKLEGVFD